LQALRLQGPAMSTDMYKLGLILFCGLAYLFGTACLCLWFLSMKATS
jgi:hypothetical protein